MNPKTPDVIAFFKDLIRLDTANPPGNEIIAADYLASIFRDHRIGYEIIEPEPTRGSIIARIGPDYGEPPVILISHLDAAAANPEQWTYPPFAAAEHDGVIYGRGTLDTKYLTAMQLAAFLHLKDETLNRPVYFVAAADEEQGSALGMAEVIERRENAFRDGIVINEGGGFAVEHSGAYFHLCTAGEKGRCAFTAAVEGTGGPSSFPSENRALGVCRIYAFGFDFRPFHLLLRWKNAHLAQPNSAFSALHQAKIIENRPERPKPDRLLDKLFKLFERMAAFRFPDDENAAASRFDELLGPRIENPLLRQFCEYNRRDTIVLQRYNAGSQVNVLPHHIGFEAELHLLPSRSREDAQRLLGEIFRDIDAGWEITSFQPGFISNLENRYFVSLGRSAADHLGGAELLPVFALGRTDGRFFGALGCDVYGFGPVTASIPFAEVLSLVHGKNERITRESLVIGVQVIEQFILAAAGESS